MSKASYTPLYSVQKYPKVASVTAFRLLHAGRGGVFRSASRGRSDVLGEAWRAQRGATPRGVTGALTNCMRVGRKQLRDQSEEHAFRTGLRP